uniref:Secreted protein n=1 Tax=Setaria viridis TaxID=4556 RepID=A0A4U6URJ9_SETVI|nr:hypothetical protein SEVIR_5G347250v2 [Setaria viridis]
MHLGTSYSALISCFLISSTVGSSTEFLIWCSSPLPTDLLRPTGRSPWTQPSPGSSRGVGHRSRS